MVDAILSSVGLPTGATSRRVRVRLYGGWYERNRPTRLAQELAGEAERHFPRLMAVSDGSRKASMNVSAELAYSLEADPSKHLWHTYRRRGEPGGLKCHDPSRNGCQEPDCPLAGIQRFIDRGRCPKPGCSMTTEQLLHRGEQKLVDSMLIADTIYLALSCQDNLCVVTSDDDMWPGIRVALALGANITQVHTKPNQSTPSHYCQDAGLGYRQLSL